MRKIRSKNLTAGDFFFFFFFFLSKSVHNCNPTDSCHFGSQRDYQSSVKIHIQIGREFDESNPCIKFVINALERVSTNGNNS